MCSSRASPPAAAAVTAARACYGQCLGGGGWILGHKIDGTQAEFVRVPFADTSTYHVPAGVADEQVLMLADILPTGYEVGVLNGRVRPGRHRRGGRRRARSACRPSSARTCSRRHASSPSTWPTRGWMRPSVSAPTSSSTAAATTPSRIVHDMTDGLGADVAIEAVGVPATFELCTPLVRPGGHVAQHRCARRAGDAAPRGLVDQKRHDHHWPGRHQLDADAAQPDRRADAFDAGQFVTHHFAMADFMEAYDVFARAGDTGALKVVLTR